jgi:hypothetical protein
MDEAKPVFHPTNGREGETTTFNECQKRPFLRLHKMIDFYCVPKAKIRWIFETLIME